MRTMAQFNTSSKSFIYQPFFIVWPFLSSVSYLAIAVYLNECGLSKTINKFAQILMNLYCTEMCIV